MEPNNKLEAETYKINDFISKKGKKAAPIEAERVRFARKHYSFDSQIVKVKASFTDRIKHILRRSSMKISNPTKDYWLEVRE